MKKRFLFYVSWKQQMSLLNDEQVRRFIDNLCNYTEEKPVDLPTDVEKAIWYGILPSLEINNKKYEKQADRSRENGKFGGAPKNNQNARKHEKQPNGLKNNPNNLESDDWREKSDDWREKNEESREKNETVVPRKSSPVSDGALGEIEISVDVRNRFKNSKAFFNYLKEHSTTEYRRFIFIYKLQDQNIKEHQEKFEDWMLNNFIELRKQK